MAKIKIAELDINTDALIKATADVKKEIDSLKKSQKDLTKNGETSSKQFVKNAADLKSLQTAYNSNVKALSANTQAVVDQTNRGRELQLVLGQEVTSIKEARAQNALLNKLRNEANTTTEEGRAEIKALNNQLDLNNKVIKENSDKYAQQKINIGNYQGALSKVSPQLASVLTQIQSTIGGLQAQKAALQGTTSTLSGTSKALRIFKIALISTGIGAIVVALGSLVSFLATTQAGIDKVTAVTRPLQAIFQSLLGVVQGLGEKMFEAFSNPKELLKDLVDFVKGQVVNRFTAFKVILEGIAELDFKKLSNGVLQAGTGVVDLTGKIKANAEQASEFFNDAINKGAEIDKAIKQRERLETTIASRNAELNKSLDEQRTILSDTAKTGQERVDAADAAENIQQKIIDNQNEIIDLEIKELKLKQSLNDTSREEEAQLDSLIAKRISNDATINKQQKQNIAARKKLQDEQLQQQQQLLDNAISKQKEELDLFIAQQGVKAKTLEEEVNIARQVSQKKIDILKKELANKKISQEAFNSGVLQAQQELLAAQTNLTISNAERELSAYEGLNSEKLNSDTLYSEESLSLEQNRLDRLAEQRREFEQTRLDEGVINQQQFNDAINEINAENDANKKEAEEIQKEADKTRQAIDLENERALAAETFEEQQIIELERLEAKRLQEVEAAEKSGADINLINEKYQSFAEDLEKKKNKAVLADNAATFGEIANLFGEASAVGKAFAIAQATVTGYQAVLNAYTTAQKSPITLVNPAYPAIRAGLAGVFAGAQVAKVSGAKFEDGGLQEVGGKRHSAGGTKFQGEDGTSFEAEKGELIGVMNRNAAQHFMAFNNSFPNGGSTPTFMQGGGIITQGVKTDGIDLNQLAEITAVAVASAPAPIVTVEDINAGQTRTADVINGADL